MTPGYSSAQVCQATGATFRQVDYWARTKLIVPSVSTGEGLGSARRYSFDDVVLCRLVMVLGTAPGQKLPRGTGLGSLVREALANGEDGWFVALPAAGPAIVTSEPTAVMAEGHDVVTLIDLDTIRRHVTEALPASAPVDSARRPPAGADAAESTGGAAGKTVVGEVDLTSGCATTTNEEDAVGISHGVFATTR